MIEKRVNVSDKFSFTSKQMRLCCLIKLITFQDVLWSLLAASCDHLEIRMTSQALLSSHTHKNNFYKIHWHVPQSLLCSLNSRDLGKMLCPQKTFQPMDLGLFLKVTQTLVLKMLFCTFLFPLLAPDSILLSQGKQRIKGDECRKRVSRAKVSGLALNSKLMTQVQRYFIIKSVIQCSFLKYLLRTDYGLISMLDVRDDKVIAQQGTHYHHQMNTFCQQYSNFNPTNTDNFLKYL